MANEGTTRTLFAAESAVALAESDTVTFPATRAVWVGGLGDLVVQMKSGQIVTFSAVPAGTLLPICITQFRAASTATLVVGLN